MLMIDFNWKLFKLIVDCLSHLEIIQKQMLKGVLFYNIVNIKILFCLWLFHYSSELAQTFRVD